MKKFIGSIKGWLAAALAVAMLSGGVYTASSSAQGVGTEGTSGSAATSSPAAVAVSSSAVSASSSAVEASPAAVAATPTSGAVEATSPAAVQPTTAAAVDVTGKVTVRLKDMYKTNSSNSPSSKKDIIVSGEVVTPAPIVTLGDRLHVNYEWSVSEENLKTVNPGDFFEIYIPTTTYLKPIKIEDPRPIEDASGTSFGTFTIINGRLKAVFNENIVGKLELKNGFFSLFIQTISDYSTNPVPDPLPVDVGIVGATVNINAIKNTHVASGGVILLGNTEVNKNDSIYRNVMDKYGYNDYDGSDRIEWRIRVNTKAYTKFVNDGEIPADSLKNVLIEDRLDSTLMEPSLDHFSFGTPMYYPASSGAISWDGYSSLWKIKKEEIVIGRHPDMTYTDFKALMLTKPAFTVGVYYGEYNSVNIVAKMGDLHGNGITYMQSYAKYRGLLKADGTPDEDRGEQDFKNRINNHLSDGKINATQAAIIIDRYTRASKINGQVVYADLRFQTVQKGGNSAYTNTANVYYGNPSSTDSEVAGKVNYMGASGGISTRVNKEIAVTKQWMKYDTATATNVAVAASSPELSSMAAVVSLYRTKEDGSGREKVGDSKTLAFVNGFTVRFLAPEEDSAGNKYIYDVVEELSTDYTLIKYEAPSAANKMGEWKIYNLFTPVVPPTPAVPTSPAIVVTPPAVPVIPSTPVIPYIPSTPMTPTGDTTTPSGGGSDTTTSDNSETTTTGDTGEDELIGIEEDDTARGDTDTSGDETEDSVDVGGDETPQGKTDVKKELAITGGLKNIFIPSLIVVGLLALALCVVSAMARKKTK